MNIRGLTYCLGLIWFSSFPIYAQLTGKGDRITGPNFATRSPVLGRHGMVATSHPLATQIALDILKQGGTAVDAAIAANAALGVVEPNNGGIGGDLFAIVWSAKDRKLYGLNASGRSPKGLSFDALGNNRRYLSMVLYRCLYPEQSMAGLHYTSVLASCPCKRCWLRAFAMPVKAFPFRR